MKKQLAIFLFVTLTFGLCISPAFGQASGSVKGVCRDVQGNPMADAIIVWTNTDNGQKYQLKTNKKGEYFSLGVSPGKYNIMVYKSADDAKSGAKELDKVSGFPVQLDENTLDFDLKKEQENAAKGQGLTPEQLKQQQEQQEKQKKEVTTVKSLNDKLNAAKAAADAGDFDTAITQLTEANALDPSRDLIWFKLGDYYRLSAPKQTDPAEKQKRLDSAVEAYQKAVDLRKAAPPSKDPTQDAKNLAAYYNNLADAYYKAHKVDDAVKTYEVAAQVDPSSAAQSYFNIGAVYTNAGRVDDANAAFDKCLAADPTRAEAYYQKGVNLLGKATLKGDKTVPVPGTVEALQKYLELSPTGPNAQSAKDLLATLGQSVETSYGNKKKPATPKKN
jgi:tetratricopeptide (TPR) repeat protein